MLFSWLIDADSIERARFYAEVPARPRADLPPGLFTLTVPTGGGKR